MKKHLSLLFAVLFMVGCTKTSSSAESETSVDPSVSVSEDVSLTPSEGPSISASEVVSEDESSKPNDPSSSEEEKDTTLRSIVDIKAEASDYASKADANGYYVSNVLADINAQLLAVEDYIGSAGGLPQYKAFFANETGTIGAHLVYNNSYETLRDNLTKHQVYNIKGYVAYHNGEIALETRSLQAPKYLQGVTLDYDYRTHAVDGNSISELQARAKAQRFNVKGVNASADIYKHTLKYLMKVENTIGLFTDGIDTIMVHGHDKMNGGLQVGSVYDVYGREGLHRFRPQIKHIGIFANNSATVNDLVHSAKAEEMSANKLYTYKYEKDEKAYIASNMVYADLFVKVFKFSGYVNFFQKGNNFTYVFDDNFKDEYYETITNASDNQTLFINNDGYVNKNLSSVQAKALYDYTPYGEKAGTKIEFYFAAYEWNTSRYWQIQVYLDTIVEVK